jgi:hypothetical protein
MMTIPTITKGNWVTSNSSLKMNILKIQYSNTEYVKFKGTLTNKTNGIVYETANYKLYYKNISHWEKVFG